MNPTKRWRALFVALGLWLLVPAGTAAALENDLFGLTPHPEQVDGIDRLTFSIPLETGAVFEDSVRVYNRTDQSLELAIYAADAEAALDETISVGFRGSEPTGVASWIDLSRRDIELPPRAEVVIPFRITVKSAEPIPNLGAIVVENTARGVDANGASRLHLVVRTVPPNTETTSQRVRPLLASSPWIFLAMIGLLVAAALVWVGARRGRRTKDTVVPAGELLEAEQATEAAPEASRPVIKRLGAENSGQGSVATAERTRGRFRSRGKTRERPLLNDALLVEIDPLDEDEEETSRDRDETRPDETSVEDEVVASEASSYEQDDHDDEEEDLPPAGSRSSSSKRPRSASTAGSRTNNGRRAARSSSRRSTGTTAAKRASSGAKKSTTKKRNSKGSGRQPTTDFIPLDDL